MAEDDRIASLKAQHAELEEALEQEIQRPLPNPAIVSDIKKQKLRIKDQIANLSPH